jgi:hypothetical protein
VLILEVENGAVSWQIRQLGWAPKDDAATKGVHEGCYVLRQLLEQSTTPATPLVPDC